MADDSTVAKRIYTRVMLLKDCKLTDAQEDAVNAESRTYAAYLAGQRASLDNVCETLCGIKLREEFNYLPEPQTRSQYLVGNTVVENFVSVLCKDVKLRTEVLCKESQDAGDEVEAILRAFADIYDLHRLEPGNHWHRLRHGYAFATARSFSRCSR